MNRDRCSGHGESIGRFVMLTGDGAPVARFASAAIAVVIVIGLAVIVVGKVW